MTKFADAKFAVAALLTPEYAEGYARTFPASLDEKSCTECLGEGKVDLSSGTDSSWVECPACGGTGRRAFQAAP